MAPVMDEIEASHSRHEYRNCCQLSLSNISLPLKEANEVALRLRGKGVDASQGGWQRCLDRDRMEVRVSTVQQG